MLYSAEQKQMLEAMGFRMYATIPSLNAKSPESSKIHDIFWQTRLGQNIQQFAQGHNLSALPIASPEQGKLAKRIVWQQIRALLKSV